ncbi:MAG: hypothetical protein V3U76_13535 [Granulosicoccus sp.]
MFYDHRRPPEFGDTLSQGIFGDLFVSPDRIKDGLFADYVAGLVGETLKNQQTLESDFDFTAVCQYQAFQSVRVARPEIAETMICVISHRQECSPDISLTSGKPFHHRL